MSVSEVVRLVNRVIFTPRFAQNVLMTETMLKRLEDASEMQRLIATVDDHICRAAIRNSPEHRVEGDCPRLSSDA